MALHAVIDRIVEGFDLIIIAAVVHGKGNDNGPSVSGTTCREDCVLEGCFGWRSGWGWRNSQLMLNDLYPPPRWMWELVLVSESVPKVHGKG